jgi:hypothetical protein
LERPLSRPPRSNPTAAASALTMSASVIDQS